MEPETKRCPQCDEEVRTEATECVHCGAVLDAGAAPSSPARSQSDLNGSSESPPPASAEHRAKAEAHKREHRYKEAEAEIIKAMELDPSDDSLRALRIEIDALIQERHLANARSLMKDHKFEDAMFEYGQVLERNPAHDDAELGLREARRTLERLRRHLEKGDEYRNQKQYEEAVKEYKRVLKLKPEHTYAKSEIEQCRRIIDMQGSLVVKADETLKAARAEYEQKRFREAVSEIQRVLEKVPDHPDALRLLKDSRYEIRKRKKILALVVILVACGLYLSVLRGFWRLSEYESYMTKARASRENRSWAEVIDYCNKALDIRSDDEAALALIAESIEQLAKLTEKARKEMRDVKGRAEGAQADIYAAALYEQAAKYEEEAESCLMAEQYVTATGCFETAKEEYQKAETASLSKLAEQEQAETEKKAKEQKQADRVKARAQEARGLAERANAPRYTRETFELAQQKMQVADEAYRTQGYAAAAGNYEEAAVLFRECAGDAAEGRFLPEGLQLRDGRIICMKDQAEMMLIPAGSYLAGSPDGKGFGNEHPRHRVTLDAFYMDTHEVTLGRYKTFLRATGHRSLPEWVAQYSTADDQPVVGVSWEDAAAYAEWAGKRLPTEAEWEYACRAATTTEFNIGDSLTHDHANYALMDGKDRWDKETAAVGSFAPNAWGLFDMHGNVWEWCRDWYDRNFYRNCPSSNPECRTDALERVVRGGSWKNSDYALRSANRGFYRPADTYNHVGFRCVK